MWTRARARTVRYGSAALFALAALTVLGAEMAPCASSPETGRRTLLYFDGVQGSSSVLHHHLTVTGGTERDHRFACAGARRALAFFRAHGLTPDLRLHIEFNESVFADLSGRTQPTGIEPVRGNACAIVGAVGTDGAPGEPARVERVVGMFHPGSGAVLVTTEASSWLRSYTYFGLPVDDEMFTSILTHEIAHALSKQLYAPALRLAELDIRVQEEYVAFVAQLFTMPDDLRAAVLARFPAHAQRFEDEAEINALSLGFSPEAFAVKSYRHFKSDQGGRAFLRRLYDGEFRPAPVFFYLY